MPNNDSRDHETWLAALDRLSHHIPDLVDDFLEVLQRNSIYEAGEVSVADLRHTAHETFTVLLNNLADKPLDVHHQSAPSRLAVRRAQQGVEIDALIAAVWQDFLVIWRRLKQIIPEPQYAILVDHTELILRTVENYIVTVQIEFLKETAHLAQDARFATERHLSRLFNAEQLSSEMLNAIAAGLDVDREEVFDLVISTPDSAQELQHAVTQDLTRGTIFGHMYRDCYVLLYQRSLVRRSTFDAIHKIPCAWHRNIVGLGKVPAVIRGLHHLVSHQTSVTSMVSSHFLWPEAVAQHLSAVLPDFPERYISGLGDLRLAELDHLVESVSSFMATGSIKDTAQETGKHRNTVINRLNLFRELTGLDVKVPQDAALVHILMPSIHALKRQMHNEDS
ncbi:helix-turn-helix domain-containing protein [Auritidibacter ignavus]|uniref:helix-turn-helix domain-containing protein n=1 Tax=Auritidibacter ignavus TaxID=678932 RepID=UPI0024487747|nr:helix-turn-helix domain-containing protein [Auritidibacter ignavus]WGH80853.1 helix-turn-helix domain-containing protein [Auritidibacter ignavus]WHS29259.1 helix-turn-helix domain-containing protein [Auritidibacter ignavus]WHS36091.1 helix-turn-helix domain-containing protein [Auritidibacter ignavus]